MESIPADSLGRQTRHKRLAVKRLQRKLIARLLQVVITRHIGYLPLGHLELDIRAIVHTLVFDILVGIIDAFDIGRRDYIRAQHKRDGRDDRRTYQIRPQQTPIAHARRKHGYDLTVVGQLGGEKYHRDKREQRAELIGKIRQEVKEIIKDCGLERCLEKRIELLVDVKHHRNRQYQKYSEYVCAEKLAYYVPIEYFHNRRVTFSII